MKGLVIFSFYNPDGIVEPYVEYLFKELKTISKLFYVVINGNVEEDSLIIIKKYADLYLIRENNGYDMGAYSDALKHIGKENIMKYEMVVLCNDTFWGPFIPFEIILKKMDRNLDFWGLNFVEGELFEHIQSYFLVFNKSILCYEELYKYMTEEIDTCSNSRMEAFVCFEVGLFEHLKKIGLKFDTYCSTNNYSIYSSPFRCIKEYGLPILKRKVDDLIDVEEKKNIIKYVDTYYNYDVGMIRMDYDKSKETTILEKKTKMPQVNREELMEFIKSYNEVYIYGVGILAQKIYFYLKKELWNLKGFVVSNDKNIDTRKIFGYNVFHYDSIKLRGGVILALNPLNTNEVKKLVDIKEKTISLWK